MKLDKLSIEIRPRRAWEAVDLGMLMAQRWWFRLSLIFLCLSLPVWLLLEFIPLELWYYRLLVFWLLLPLFERPLLYFLSQAVFNEFLSLRQVLKAAPKLMFRQIVQSISWRRLSPSRSMDASVIVLENLKGSQRSSRISTLHREDASPAAWLSVICFVFVYAIAMALLIVCVQLASSFLETPWWQLIEQDGWYPFFNKWIGLLIYYLLYVGFVLVSPFYVATGFALYLNRRIKLEAWDVEIAFRKIVQKRERKTSKLRSVSALLFLIFVSYSGLTPPQSFAEDTSEQSQVRADIRAVLESEDFNQIKIDKDWSIPGKNEVDKKDRDTRSADGFFKLLESLANGLAKWGELLLWVAVICLVFYLIYRYRAWFAELIPEQKTEKRIKPEVLFGLDVTEESLPDDISAAANNLWLQGKAREAIALLYRACLAQLISRGLELQDGDTELECLKTTESYLSVLKLRSRTLDYFRDLTSHWRRLAYGHIEPSEAAALDLCSSWKLAWQPSLDEGV